MHTVNDLILQFTNKPASLFDDWKWLFDPEDFELLFMNLLGDAFLRKTDNTIHMLDVTEGELLDVAESFEDFQQKIMDREIFNQLFFPKISDAMSKKVKKLEENECFSFKKPPVLGGKFKKGNLKPCDMEVHFSIYGQIHEELRALDEDTEISGVAVQ